MDGMTGNEHRPLFEAGFHDLELGRLEEVLVDRFEDSGHRRELLQRFNAFVEILRQIGVSCEVWLDGSFVTQKPFPADVDVVLCIDENESLEGVSVENSAFFWGLINDRNRLKYLFNCDVYICPNDIHQRGYWRGFFGFTRNEQPKGIVRIYLNGQA